MKFAKFVCVWIVNWLTHIRQQRNQWHQRKKMSVRRHKSDLQYNWTMSCVTMKNLGSHR